MQAEQFYQTEVNKPYSLKFLSQSECEDLFKDLSKEEKLTLSNQRFMGNLGELAMLFNPLGEISRIYIGTGKGSSKEVAIALAKIMTRLPEGCYQSEKPLDFFAKLNWALSQYCFDRYKKQAESPKILLVDEGEYQDLLVDVNATFLVRDLINTPTNDMGPSQLAYAMLKLAKDFDATFQQWEGADLLAANFPAIHAVGRAAEDAPRLLSLAWGEKDKPKIAIIGKGVCFDTGGLDIKPANYMRLMKKDMGGAAHALALAQWIMANQLPVSLEVYIPAVENAVSANAFRPGDVLKMRNGLTVEVDNTDAEGRLVLADALTKASESNPELIINFATLTGAARSAVGTEIAAMFSNNDALSEALMKKGEAHQDPLWRLPLFKNYESLLDSNIADLSNCNASPFAGAIVAALFLQRFIPDNISFVHFDIMAWNERSKPGRPEGGEAMGLRAVAYYLRERYGF